MKVKVSRKAHFNAAHRLYNSEWSDARNAEVFGKCSNPSYHDEIEEKFDHKNLNEQVEEFKELNPTAENIVVVIWEKIKKKISNNLILEVTLYETPRNFVSYDGNT